VYFKNIDSFLLALSGYKELFLFMEARSWSHFHLIYNI
jgi:hypothetical protein